MSAVLLSEAKTHLQITSDRHDAELQDFIDAAETRLAHEVGPLAPVEVVERHTGPGPLILRQIPVVEVSGVTEQDIAVDAADLDADLNTGILYRTGSFSTYPRGTVVTYTAGYETLPADLRQGVLELIRHLWDTQRGSGPGGARANLLNPDGDPTTAAGLAAYTLPNRVKELIAPYVSRGLIA